MRHGFLALLLLAAPAFAGVATEDALLHQARESYLNTPDLEHTALAASAGRVTRKGDTLYLRRAGRKPLTLTSNTAPCADTTELPVDACLTFTLIADLPARHAYLVAEGHYEGCPDLLLIDSRSGRKTIFAAVPVFSPDGKRLLIQNDCEADGSASDNHLEIWQRQGDGWQLEWAYTDKDAYQANPALENIFHSKLVSWSSDNRITLALSAQMKNEAEEKHWNGTLSLNANGWRLHAFEP